MGSGSADSAEVEPIDGGEGSHVPVLATNLTGNKVGWDPRHRSAKELLGLGVVVVVAAMLSISGWWLSAPLVGLAGTAAVLTLGLMLWRRRPTIRLRDVMPCYLSVQDRQLRIIQTNTLFRRDFGEGIGQHCYRVYKDRDSPCPNCPVLKTFADGTNHSGEEVVVTKDGEVANVMVTSAPLVDRRGRTTAVVELSTNITETKKLQQELDQSRQRFKRLFDVVPCYISIQNREFEVVESNELFKKDFGDRMVRAGCLSEAGDVKRRCYQLYKGREKICPDCIVEKTFRDGEVHSSEEQVITRDGRTADMIVYSMPVTDERGEIAEVMEVSTNITEVKRLQNELAMVGIAVAGMTHRMKNILTGLEGGIFVVNTGFEMGDQGMVDDGWDMVQRNVSRVSRIAKDLLYCAKERPPMLQGAVCPEAILREVHELYRARAANEGIELVLDLCDPPHTGRFDPDALHSLILNLTANAVDACRFDTDPQKKHRIVLRCREQQGDTLIEVSDNGTGISEDISDKVFRGFFSVKGTEGTGIGLLVVRRVVEAHRASVTFDTKEGEGTTFRVVFPKAALADTPSAAGKDEAAQVAESVPPNPLSERLPRTIHDAELSDGEATRAGGS